MTAKQAEGNPAKREDRSFDDFFRAEQPRLIAMALALCPGREAAHDLAQEALVRTYLAWPKVSRLDRPGAWTRRVLLNLVVDSARRRHTELRLSDRLAREHRTSPDAYAHAESYASFWSAVRDLPKRQRWAIVLHYVDDLSVCDVAAVLNVAPGTVKASLWQARRKLASLATADRDWEKR